MSKYAYITYSGEIVDPLNLDEGDVNLNDIAHALSMMCRYNGHCRFHYSVAQHSVLMSYKVPPELQQAALLHDAGEAYLSDIPRPIKDRMPEAAGVEDSILSVIFQAYNVPWKHLSALKEYDVRICIDEMKVLMNQVDPYLLENYEPLGVSIVKMHPEEVEEIFKKRFHQLFGEDVA